MKLREDPEERSSKMTVETLLRVARALPQREQLLLASLLIQQAQTVLSSTETKTAVLLRVRGMFRGRPGTAEFHAEKSREVEAEEQKFFGHRPGTSE
jgi:hypothetical protein